MQLFLDRAEYGQREHQIDKLLWVSVNSGGGGEVV